MGGYLHELNVLLTLAAVLGLLMVVLAGLPRLGSVDYLEASFGGLGIPTAVTVIFFAYLGFEDLANLA